MIYLLRHGETLGNSEGRFQGRLESPLSEHGQAQARAVGARLAALAAADPGDWTIEASPLGRARQTGAIVAEAMGLPEPRIEPRLIEADYGALEGLTRPEVEARWPHLAGVIGVFGYAPDGESLADLDARAAAWLAERSADPRRVIAVAHASIGRAIRGAYVGAPFEQYRLFETPQDAFHRLHEGRIERIDCGPAALARA
ncbi:MAG TPA: histidine phosphatase family protein [Caulobacteraceae bacterium]|nr:histidine phosphatase family protein [Caulobacteraceae bacterium]